MSRNDESIDAGPSGASERDHVGSLLRGLGVIETLAAHPAGLTLTETAERMGLTRAGARRFLLTLVAAGYAVQDGRTFRLSPRLISQARIWLSGRSLWSFAEPFMRTISERFNESCSAAVLADEDVVYVARVAGARIVSVGLHVGTRLPAHCTSMGRVLLSGLSETQIADFLGRATVGQTTPMTITDRTALAERIRMAARDGYAMIDQELEIGLRSIAVPVRDGSGRIAAAINLSTQSARMSMEELERDVLLHLREAARSIEDYFVVQ